MFVPTIDLTSQTQGETPATHKSLQIVHRVGAGSKISIPSVNFESFSAVGMLLPRRGDKARCASNVPTRLSGNAVMYIPGLMFVMSTYTESYVFAVTLSGCRHDFKRISTPKAELHSQDTATTKERSTSTTCLDHGYDPQIANGGNHGGSDGSSVQERADERLPLVQQQLLVLESGELRSTHGGSGGKTPSEGEGIAEGEGFDACGGESLQGGGGMPFWTGCLRPLKLLKEERVGTPIFVYVLISVRRDGSGPLTMTLRYSRSDVYSEFVRL